MSRFKTAILVLLFTAALAAVLPVQAFASIEVDEEEVIFRLADTGAAKVFLTGDFNNWNPTMDSMVKRNGGWEVRLYLVPGRYRYAFVVDGETVPDPDNPNRDAEGNTYFIFVEEDEVYSIAYEVTAAGERKIEEIYDPIGALTASATKEYSLFTASGGVKGEIDGSIRGEILVGAEYETTARDPIKAFLVRAKGEWVTDRFSLGAFHRSGRVGFDDPLSLFTDVGPYAYPLDLFCRGAQVSAGWKSSVEARVFFANRIDLPHTIFDLSGYSRELGRRDVKDKDMIGASLTGRFGSFRLDYMYRQDRGPDQSWPDDNFLSVLGYESRISHGLLLEIEKKDWPVLTAQYLTGTTKLIARSTVAYLDISGSELSGLDQDLEEGYRALAGLSWSRGPFLTLLKWHRTTIERNNEVYDYLLDWEDAGMDVYEAGVSYSKKKYKIDLKLDLLDFSGSGGMGGTFWLNDSNFWLDGNMLRTELFQFIESKRMWRATLGFEESGVEAIPGPYRLEGYLTAKANWDGDEDKGMFEITGGKGIRLGSYLSIHTDMRFVSYSDDRWTGESSFFDFWGGLRGDLGGSGWAALGVGIAPHRFDRWYFDFTGDGRESYLLNQGTFFSDSYGEEPDLLKSLGEAEKTLSEEWRLSFEAGFSF